MKNRVSSRYRSLLVRGGAVCAVSILLLCGTGCHDSKDTDKSSVQPTTTTEVSTTCTTSTTMSTTTTSTTSSTTTGTTTTELMMIAETPMTTVQVNTVQIEPEPTTAWVEPNPLEQTYTELPISDYERTLLRNVVASEYGSDTHGYGGSPVTPYERACVVAVVMNRVNDSRYPNTIEGVLTQPNQFSGYWACNYEWNTVTNNVRDGVDYYFAHPEEFGSWTGFYGDGRYNYFY